jgi:hypothetical protein
MSSSSFNNLGCLRFLGTPPGNLKQKKSYNSEKSSDYKNFLIYTCCQKRL